MKRGESGISAIVGVNKPIGMTSHDVVNRVRTIFGEKRVGHAGTLDPAASGVLPVCIGPATRLADYIGGSSKRYLATITFGFETDTDDAEGTPVKYAPIPEELADREFATVFISSLIGEHSQLPPQYSAIKVDGRRAYEKARKGETVELAPRMIEVRDAAFLTLEEHDELLDWVVVFEVSKGTYIRSLARDIGQTLGSAAHVSSLERLSVGRIDKTQCVSLEGLESLKLQAVLDPVRVLGLRYAFVDEHESLVSNGTQLPADQVILYEPLLADEYDDPCACTTSICKSSAPLDDGELICMIVGNKLKALYAYDAARNSLSANVVFSMGVMRA